MPISYPQSLDVLNNPTATDDTSTVDHASQHANANDAIEALQAKVGVDSSAVATSLEFHDGIQDDLGILPSYLTADWLDTEYDNQNSPSTFLTMSDVGGVRRIFFIT